MIIPATIAVGDCDKIDLPDDSVDLVVTSPPYEDARTYDIGYSLSGQAWVDWAVPRFVECLRVCRGLVCWVVQGRTRKFRWSAVPALLIADLHRQGIHLRCPPLYHRVGIPGSGGPDWWRSDYEFCICATSGGKLPWSDNTATGKPPKYQPGGEMSYRHQDGIRKNARDKPGTRAKRFAAAKRPHTKRRAGGEMEEQIYRPPTLANPGNVIACKVGGGKMGSLLAHENEAPFPEALVEPFILSFCPAGGTVLDPMCGSGTTLAVALKHGRKAIGFDIRESQVVLANKRVAECSRAGGAMKIISFFTPTYEGEVKAFEESCNKFGYIPLAKRLQSAGSWRLNCGMKPRYIRDCLMDFQEPVLWIDIDGRMRAPWDLNLEESHDVAFWFIPHRVMKRPDVPHGAASGNDGIASGTMLWNYTPAALAFLDAWCEAEKGQGLWEQQILGEVWYDRPVADLRTFRLHQRYCKVFDVAWFEGEGEIVVEHMQASRRLKRTVR